MLVKNVSIKFHLEVLTAQITFRSAVGSELLPKRVGGVGGPVGGWRVGVWEGKSVGWICLAKSWYLRAWCYVPWKSCLLFSRRQDFYFRTNLNLNLFSFSLAGWRWGGGGRRDGLGGERNMLSRNGNNGASLLGRQNFLQKINLIF